ncbi:MAG: (d)CMP kinase [Peptococcaceae bacterium]|nr:(d)CMP kinase [Peptococcaceae bacterium]
MKHIIAIDGPAAAGKSTVARQLAADLGYTYIDTGAMYRAVALACMQQHIPFTDESGCGEIAIHSDIQLEAVDGGCIVLLNGADVTAEIRTPLVAQGASKVSVIPKVREALVAKQRQLAEHCNVVMEGRDIGTVVFPEADCKIFLSASLEKRAQRRYADMLAKGNAISLDEIRAEMAERDERDSSRTHSPLKQAADAHYLDSTDLTMEAVLAFIEKQMIGE